jgi:hypothetical protein
MVEERKVVFVFGSNERGMHGKGTALKAYKEYGAIYGQGYGPQGDAFGIPTKDKDLKPLDISQIAKYVKMFLRYAELNPHIQFTVTRVGCGLAGYTDDDIGPLFKGAPTNCLLPAGWRNY